MARTGDQIVAEQLGSLHLQLVIAQARNEALTENVAALMARISVLEKQLSDAGIDAGINTPDSKEPVPESPG